MDEELDLKENHQIIMNMINKMLNLTHWKSGNLEANLIDQYRSKTQTILNDIEARE
jgi:hypothetical protein